MNDRMMDDRVSIAVLAGGRSSRMGRDKAMLEIGGRTLLELIVGELRGCGMPVLVIGRERPDGWRFDDVRFLPDEAPGLGPLGGIVSALRAARGEVIAVACDMPLIDRRVIDLLIAAASEDAKESIAEDAGDDRVPATDGSATDDADGIAVTLGGSVEPLCTLYRLRALPMLEMRMERGELSLKGAIEAGRFRRLPIPTELAGRLRNLNTPGDLETLLRELEGGGG